MTTPILDFVRKYSQSGALRLHMPGHKGVAFLGAEQYDVTEIDGADSLYEASGIILESEKNAGALFGADTFYSTEGSSLSIRAMLYLSVLYAKKEGREPLILSGRNAHKSFISASMLIGFDVEWLSVCDDGSYLSSTVSADMLDSVLKNHAAKPAAVYITTPDYLGCVTDVRAISDVCHKHGVLLLVDNAHGAYLRFLPESRHPIDLGADMCADSAHKTLPVLTGGAYLHISKKAPKILSERAKGAMALFGSTSPSYLILESLDFANKYIFDGYRERLCAFVKETEALKERLKALGYRFIGDEPLKLTVLAKSYGYTGESLARLLFDKGIVVEFYDPDFLVLMLTPELDGSALLALYEAFVSIQRLEDIFTAPPKPSSRERVLSARDAMLCESEVLPLHKCRGRILAEVSAACPPAVPILVCGERIDGQSIECFEYYGTKELRVVRDCRI